MELKTKKAAQRRPFHNKCTYRSGDPDPGLVALATIDQEANTEEAEDHHRPGRGLGHPRRHSYIRREVKNRRAAICSHIIDFKRRSATCESENISHFRSRPGT